MTASSLSLAASRVLPNDALSCGTSRRSAKALGRLCQAAVRWARGRVAMPVLRRHHGDHRGLRTSLPARAPPPAPSSSGTQAP
jgi:hypothetical protein